MLSRRGGLTRRLGRSAAINAVGSVSTPSSLLDVQWRSG